MLTSSGTAKNGGLTKVQFQLLSFCFCMIISINQVDAVGGNKKKQQIEVEKAAVEADNIAKEDAKKKSTVFYIFLAIWYGIIIFFMGGVISKPPNKTTSTPKPEIKKSSEPADFITKGFLVSSICNFMVMIFSKGFSDNLGKVDPLFNINGCISIILFGLAYASVAYQYKLVPYASLTFVCEKLFYSVWWILWYQKNGSTLPAIKEEDYVTYLYFSQVLGPGAIGWMFFFIYSAWTIRDKF